VKIRYVNQCRAAPIWEAARRVEGVDRYSCNTLTETTKQVLNFKIAETLVNLYSLTFCPEDQLDDVKKWIENNVVQYSWLHKEFDTTNPFPNPELQNFRVLALCFFAAMIEAGEFDEELLLTGA
jgi:hypothetical protein